MAEIVTYIADQVFYGLYLFAAHMETDIALAFLVGVAVCVGFMLIKYIAKKIKNHNRCS